MYGVHVLYISSKMNIITTRVLIMSFIKELDGIQVHAHIQLINHNYR